MGERSQPNLFILGASARANVARVAEKAGVSEEFVDKFLAEFQAMKQFFVKMGTGLREGKTKEQMAKEIENDKDFLKMGSSPSSSKNQPYVNPKRQQKKALKLASQRKKR